MNNEINLIIPLNHPLCPQIIFNIKQKKKEILELINEIYNIINNQQNEINKLNNEIYKLNNELYNLEEMNENQKN